MAATKISINVVEHFVKHYIEALIPAETIALTEAHGTDVKHAVIGAAWAVLAPVIEAGYIFVKKAIQKSAVEKDLLDLLQRLADEHKSTAKDVAEVKAVVQEIAPATDPAPVIPPATPEAPATPAS